MNLKENMGGVGYTWKGVGKEREGEIYVIIL